MTFDYFQVPLEHQGRVLTWGIVGAILMRGVMIAFGVAVVKRFQWITLVFAAVLLVSSYKLLVEYEDEDHDLSQNTLVRCEGMNRDWIYSCGNFHLFIVVFVTCRCCGACCTHGVRGTNSYDTVVLKRNVQQWALLLPLFIFGRLELQALSCAHVEGLMRCVLQYVLQYFLLYTSARNTSRRTAACDVLPMLDSCQRWAAVQHVIMPFVFMGTAGAAVLV